MKPTQKKHYPYTPEEIENLWELMGSTDTTNHALALQLMKGLGMPAEIKIFLEEWRSFFQKTKKKPFSYAKVLAEFVGMIDIDAQDCSVTHLPQSYRLCPLIESVGLSGIHITHLPKTLFDLPLIHLHIVSTPLQALPTQIGKCTTLERLHIRHTPLKKLPSSMGNLSMMSHLSVTKCALESLPASFEKMENLMYLNVQNNQLKQIPKWLLNLLNLRKVYLQNNRIDHIPKWFDKNYWEEILL